MKSLFILFALLVLGFYSHAQTHAGPYTINADTVTMTSCDSSELVIRNHTDTVPGFLFNAGGGRAIFKRALVRAGNGAIVIGADTLKPWQQGGNAFGATGVLGTLDNNHLDFYTDALSRMRLSNAGNLLLGTNSDNGNKMQIVSHGGVLINSNMSLATDFVKIGGYNNFGDGQDVVLSASADSGNSYYQIVTARNGSIGLGYGARAWIVGTPPIRLFSTGIVSMVPPVIYYGNTSGPANSSALITTVSNTNEWNQGLNNYPNGQNYYYFGTVLNGPQTGYKRAPLLISGDELHFLTGAVDAEAMRISEGQNLLIGTTTDNGNRLQVNGKGYFTSNVCLAGLTNDSTQTRVLVSDVNGNVYYRSAASLAANNLIRSSMAVNGTIKAKKLLLSPDMWADYVFDSTYQLPRLAEVEAYIHREHHLPGIPSAAAIEKDSLDVGAGQAALLKKIEELTLYTIEQKKEIDSMKARMEKLENLLLEKSKEK